MTAFADADQIRRHVAAGWWRTETLSDDITRWAADRPDTLAYVSEADSITWAGYDALARRLAGVLVGLGLERGDRVAVQLPDGPFVHAAFVAAERAGLVVMGIGHRAGDGEVAHLVEKSGARAAIVPVDAPAERWRGVAHVVGVAGTAAAPEVMVDGTSVRLDEPDGATTTRLAERRLGPDELCLLNSTSGTTGLPKCVMQTQNRWYYFHTKAAAFGELTGDDVFMSVVPAPFGFGLWTSHFSPTILGVPCAVTERFSAETMIRLIAEHRVTVLCAVSTQFVMMLNSPALDEHDVSSLRVMFTGGEAIPYQRAVEFEERTGCTLLNFYGSNETGMLSGTTVADPPERRLASGGRIVPEMQVRLYEPDGGPRVPGDRGEGQPACQGPALSPGYWDDPEANGALFTDDGWMFMGDIVTIDDEGWLTVVGRTSDFIIRGGKNISAPAVEDEIDAHPGVAMVAVVPAPDPVFGERVAAFVELVPGHTLTLDDLRDHLAGRGVSKEWWPEHLVVEQSLPRSSGGKVAKGELKERARDLPAI